MVVGISITIPFALGEALLGFEALAIRKGWPNKLLVAGLVFIRSEAFL